MLVAHNVSDGFATSSAMRFTAAGFDTLYGDITGSPSGAGAGAWTVTLPPRASMIWKVR